MEMGLRISDIHAHLLPGLDDGPRTPKESLRLCKALVCEGVHTVVATPHLCDGRSTATASRIRQGVEELSEACARNDLDLRILPGSEVRVHPELLDAFDAAELVTVADEGRYLFLEFHPQCVTPIDGLVFELMLRGVRPILCHPERHVQFWRNESLLADLIEQGCVVQMAAASLLREQGSGVRRIAERWLRAGLVHVVASDAHSVDRRPPRLRRAAERLVALGGVELARRLLETHPMRIVRGEPLEGTWAANARPAGQREVATAPGRA